MNLANTEMAKALMRDLLQGVRDARTLSRSDECLLRRLCRERARASQQAIARLIDRGHYKNARRAQRKHMLRVEVHLDALLRAASKRWPEEAGMNEALREKARLRRLQAVFEKRGDVGRLARPARARQFSIPKPNSNGRRTVTDFFWVDRARQRVLSSALQPFANLHDAQFMLARDPRRRGPAAVREALLAALNECGDSCCFVQLDIRDFHGSIRHEWLEEHLVLSPEVTQRQVHMGGMLMGAIGMMDARHARHDAIQEGGQRGIPQGSTLSPLVAEQVMADILRGSAALKDLPHFVWSDNIGVLVPHLSLREFINLVKAEFSAHPAGPFELTDTVHVVTREFKFLGTHYRYSANDGARVYVPAAIAQAWTNAVLGDILTASKCELNRTEVAIIRKRAEWGWWGGWANLEQELLGVVSAARRVQMPE